MPVAEPTEFQDLEALGYSNLTPFNMSRWVPTTYGGGGGYNNWRSPYWGTGEPTFYESPAVNVLTPSGNYSWHGLGGGQYISANPYREMMCLDWPYLPNVGDLCIMRFMYRSGPAQRSIGYDSSSIMLFDEYPPNPGSQPDTIFGQVREHGNDARNAQGQYRIDVETDSYEIWHYNQYAEHSLGPMDTISNYPETDGWIEMQLTSIVPQWNPSLTDFYGNSGAYECLTYYGHGWSPQRPYHFAPVFLGCQGSSGQDRQQEIWLGDCKIYYVPVGEYDFDTLVVGEETPTVGFTADMWPWGTRTKTASMDMYPKFADKTVAASMDIVPTILSTVSTLADLWPETASPASFSADIYAEGLGTKMFDADIWPKITSTAAVIADLWPDASFTESFTMDMIPKSGLRVLMDIFPELATLSFEELGLLRRVIAKMEAKHIGNYCFEAGCVEPGCDNCDTPMRRIIKKLKEK